MINIQEHVPLASFTTLGVGGPARYFTEVSGVDELRDALTWAEERQLALFMLGGGSNLLVSDDGFDGLVIKIALKGIETTLSEGDVGAAARIGETNRSERGQSIYLRVAAGEEWDAFVAHCVEADLAGIECLSGIPGSVGATPIQNVGAYGQEVAESITSVEVLDRTDLSLRTLTPEECEFGYRSSFFKNVDSSRYVVTGVNYSLLHGGAPALKYPELRRYVEEQVGDRAPSLREVRDAVIAIRKRKGMVIDANDPDSRSAGSFFMNPLLRPEEFAALRKRAADAALLRQGEELPQFPAAGGKVKASAAWLIERAGFHKGHGDGPAGISSKHTLAIVNRGEAKASDIVLLVEEIQARVRQTFGIEIQPEPNFVGFG